MKTLKILLGISFLISFTLGQTPEPDTSSSASADSAETMDVPIIADEVQTVDSVDVVSLEMDSSMTPTEALVEEDSSTVEAPEMVMISIEPQPVSVAGLMNEGYVYYWSNDHLEGLGLEAFSYINVMDPTVIAIKANDCMDIVCHLLASDSTGLNYVIVGVTDSSNYKVYDTATKVVVLEAVRDSLSGAMDAFLRMNSGVEYVAVEQPDTLIQDTLAALVVEGMSPPDNRREPFLKVKRRNFRSMDELFTNPANMAREYTSRTSWNLFPDFKIGLRNSLLTPGWYKKWWTTGEHWDEDTKSEYLATLRNEELVLNITPDFHTLFGFRIGQFGINISGKSHIKMVLPGSIPTTLIPVLPIEGWTLNEPIENGGFELETIPFVLKSTFSYGQPIKTPYGEVKVGVGLNIYEAAGYVRVVSDDLTVTFTEDSVFATASGEGWATSEGISGPGYKPEINNLDPMNTLSNPTFGLDLGGIMDLYPLIHQEVEVQLSLRNIGAKYSWSGLTHEAWTFEQRMPIEADLDTDSLENYQVTETTVIESQDSYDIDVPTVLNLAGFYQPIPMVMIGLGIEKAFTDEVRFGYSPDLELYYQLNLYPTKFLDFSYYHQTKFGDPVHTFGTGLHFRHFDAGVTFSIFNGINSDAKGIGFGLRSSLHF